MYVERRPASRVNSPARACPRFGTRNPVVVCVSMVALGDMSVEAAGTDAGAMVCSFCGVMLWWWSVWGVGSGDGVVFGVRARNRPVRLFEVRVPLHQVGFVPLPD